MSQLKLAGRRLNASSRVLPDFIIIGAQKAGTSSLYHYLVQHPHVMAARKKEIHFFDRHWPEGESWYRASFPTASQLKREAERVGGTVLSGEASPSYLFHPLAPARAAQLVPTAKLIVLLRDPVERAYSHWRMEHRRGVDTLSFPEALEAESERTEAEYEKVANSDDYFSRALRRYSYAARGYYADQLKRWFEHFPREQFLILDCGRMFRDPVSIYATTLQFLGLPETTSVQFDVVNQGPAMAALDEDVREQVRARFADSNEALYELLDRRFDW